MLLACVQTKLETEAYRNEQDFCAWILEQTRKALQQRPVTESALVAFPELVGLPLLFFLERTNNKQKILDASLDIAREHWRESIGLGLRHLNFSASAFLLPHALKLHQAYTRAFSEAAKNCNCYIVAGSIFLAKIESEAAKGTFVASGAVQNISYTFAPSGKILSRQAKINLTAGIESQIGLKCGQKVLTTQTELGKLSTLICYDAFFETLIERTDQNGTSILVQPSANAAIWDGSWSGDATKKEGQEWLARGPLVKIQGRENIRFCLNPMLVGSLYELNFEGRSGIFANKHLEPGLGDDQGLLAIAPTVNEFATVVAKV